MDHNAQLSYSVTAASGGSMTTATGSFHVDGDTTTYDTTYTVATGTLYFSTTSGKYAFVLNNNAVNHLALGDSQIVTFDVDVTDSLAHTPTTIALTITGTNDIPSLSIAAGTNGTAENGSVAYSVNEDTKVSGTFTVQDPDSDGTDGAVKTGFDGGHRISLQLDADNSSASGAKTPQSSVNVGYPSPEPGNDAYIFTTYGKLTVNTGGTYTFEPNGNANALDQGDTVSMHSEDSDELKSMLSTEAHRVLDLIGKDPTWSGVGKWNNLRVSHQSWLLTALYKEGYTFDWNALKDFANVESTNNIDSFVYNYSGLFTPGGSIRHFLKSPDGREVVRGYLSDSTTVEGVYNAITTAHPYASGSVAQYATDVDHNDKLTFFAVKNINADPNKVEGDVVQSIKGIYGTLVIQANGNYTYVLDYGATPPSGVAETFQIYVRDTSNAVAETTIPLVIVVTPANGSDGGSSSSMTETSSQDATEAAKFVLQTT